jgi:protein-tyrosine-phosphatase
MKKTFPYKTILVACSVNTARSRMAEGYLQKFCDDNELDVEIISGGISSHARDGMLISMDAKFAMREEDIHLSETALSVDLKKKEHRHRIEKADLILTLTEQHKEEIKKFVNNNHKEIYTLKEFAGECGDIEDPSMKGIEGFRIARDKIKECLDKGLQKYF